MPINPYCRTMHLARFRHFTRLLALVLLVGLTMPVLATSFVAGIPVGVHSHIAHSDHGHADAASAKAQAVALGRVRPGKTSQHCPGCLTAAECALSCLGAGVLPLPPILVPSLPVVKAWTVSASQVPAGVRPIADLDPPRPVLIR